MLWYQQGGVYCRTGFLGHDDLAPVYASADVHVSCSHFETLGNTGKLRSLVQSDTYGGVSKIFPRQHR